MTHRGGFVWTRICDEHERRRWARFSEFVILFVRTDPDPFDPVFAEVSHGAVMVADANGEACTASVLQFLEIERRMILILLPEPIVLSRELLNMRRQRVEQFPKARRRF